jgi:hypothetical protein
MKHKSSTVLQQFLKIINFITIIDTIKMGADLLYVYLCIRVQYYHIDFHILTQNINLKLVPHDLIEDKQLVVQNSN